MCTLFKSVLICWAIAASCYALQQEVILYENANNSEDIGAILGIRSKVANMSSNTTGYSGFLDIHQSYCYTGYWRYYSEVNYTGQSQMHYIQPGLCYGNKTLPYSGSIRYLGPLELKTESISFYKEENTHGEEVLIATEAFGHVPFHPLSLFSTGWSNWTFFSGDNFDGNASCYRSSSEFHLLERLATSFPIFGSVLKGCPNIVDIPTFYP